MGNAARPGTVVVREIDHDPFAVDGEQYLVRELVWNGIDGRSYDLVRRRDDQVLTEDESFDSHPTDAQIAAVLEEHGLDAEPETCERRQKESLVATAHWHDNEWVGT
ncbi:hypothetical protein [Streptomyces sp. WM6378]|uniref:hypothetical protein n=1 Tax=Streptomyces sp. WM6378 TaxID=1415557 RepID=UPI0006ADCF4A|nr:hypothetical protein [Streptomyces sp. WM6378]KOU43626.1 hypothetical protein ADK54_17740 [Streptomyces sp. WM6378]